MSLAMRRRWLDDLTRLNELKLADYGDPEIATRIAQYELAFRMQASVPELTRARCPADARRLGPASTLATELYDQGRDFRLTDVHGRVVHGVIA